MAIVTVDSYGGSNYNNNSLLYSALPRVGQSFTNEDNVVLDSCIFYLRKVGTITGTATAKIYAHTGTFGTDGTPTGTALATSDTLDVSTLTTSYAAIIFSFSGAERITLSPSTYYCVEIEYTGGDASNNIHVATDSSSPTHSGIANYYYDSVWYVQSMDRCFYIYGDDGITNTTNFFNFI